ncbi:MAG: hypothetical protein ACI7YS_11235 [Flavobacterium sp.]
MSRIGHQESYVDERKKLWTQERRSKSFKKNKKSKAKLSAGFLKKTSSSPSGF